MLYVTFCMLYIMCHMLFNKSIYHLPKKSFLCVEFCSIRQPVQVRVTSPCSINISIFIIRKMAAIDVAGSRNIHITLSQEAVKYIHNYLYLFTIFTRPKDKIIIPRTISLTHPKHCMLQISCYFCQN